MTRGRGTGRGGRWLVLLATPLIWTAHFALVYAAASLEITLRGTAGWPTRAFVVAATLAALAAIALFGLAAHRGRAWAGADGSAAASERDAGPPDNAHLWRRAGTWLAVLSFWGVLWQALPALMLPGAPESHHAIGGGANLPPVAPERRD